MYSMPRAPGARGVSSPVGVVLLLGITIAAVTITVLTGSVVLAAVTDDARSTSAENAMSQLSSQTSLVALGETESKRFDLGSVDGGDLRFDGDAGHVTIRIEREGSADTIFEDSFGTIEYTGDRRSVAMQGGGVWTAEGDRSRMVSPPEYHYRGETLTFPIVRLQSDGGATARTGTIRRSNVSTSAFADEENPLLNGTVVVEIRSDYYEGWYSFFSQRADGEVTKDDENRTVTVRLVAPEDVRMDKPLSLGSGGYEAQGNDPLHEDDYELGASHPSPSAVIDERLDEADGENVVSDCFDNENDTCTAGLYHAGGDVTLSNDVEFDTSEGDIVIAIDGDLDVGGHDLNITDDTENEVRYYVNGDFHFSTATIGTAAETVDAKRTQFYVNGDVAGDTTGGGNTQIDAIIYAPNADFEIAGNPTLRGAFVFNSVDVGGTPTIEHDADLADIELRITGGPGQNPITYLHVSENVVTVEFD